VRKRSSTARRRFSNRTAQYLTIRNIYKCSLLIVLRIRIHIWIRIHRIHGSGSGSISQRYGPGSRILLSLSKKSKKNLDFYCFVTSLSTPKCHGSAKLLQCLTWRPFPASCLGRQRRCGRGALYHATRAWPPEAGRGRRPWTADPDSQRSRCDPTASLHKKIRRLTNDH
jgi:hypothetical protein